MFSRFRMSPIVESQGSDWDWLRLIVASGTVHVEERKENTLKIQSAEAGGLLPA